MIADTKDVVATELIFYGMVSYSKEIIYFTLKYKYYKQTPCTLKNAV